MENEKIMLDLTDKESKTDVEGCVRAYLLNLIEEFLKSKFEGVRRSGATELTFPAAIASDEGFTVDVGAIVNVKIPKYYNIIRKSGEKAGEIRPGYNVTEAVYFWENDPTTMRKLKKEKDWLEQAKERVVPADPFEYDFDELVEKE